MRDIAGEIYIEALWKQPEFDIISCAKVFLLINSDFLQHHLYSLGEVHLLFNVHFCCFLLYSLFLSAIINLNCSLSFTLYLSFIFLVAWPSP